MRQPVERRRPRPSQPEVRVFGGRPATAITFLAHSDGTGRALFFRGPNGALNAVDLFGTGSRGSWRVDLLDVKGCVAIKDGRALAFARGSEIEVFDVFKGSIVTQWVGHSGVISALCGIGDGHQLLTSSADGTLRLWDAARGTTLAVAEGHGGSVLGCTLSPTTSRVISWSADGTIRIWDAATLEQVAVYEASDVSQVALTSDGTALVWDLAGRHQRIPASATSSGERAWLAAHQDRVNDAGWIETDGKWRCVTVSDDETVRLWDPESLACVGTFFGAAPLTRVLVVGDVICAGDELGNVWLLDVRDFNAGEVPPERSRAAREQPAKPAARTSRRRKPASRQRSPGNPPARRPGSRKMKR